MPNLFSRNLDDIGMDEEEQKNKRKFFSPTPNIEDVRVPRENIFSKLFRAPKAQTEIDELGLEKPVRQGLSPFAKILGVALPALYGASKGDLGLGLLSGVNAIGAQTQKNYAEDKDDYDKLRQYKIAQSTPTTEQKNFEYYTNLPKEQKVMFDEYKTLTKSPYEGLRYDLAKEQAQYMKQKNEDERQRKSEESLDKKVTKLSDSLGNAQELVNALSEVDNKIGFKIDDYDPSTNSVKGIEVNLPGKNFPGIGRVSFYSDKAQQIDSAIARIFNTELKDRSGAAVTTPEMDRMKEEFASGKFNTEAQKLQAIKDYKRLLYEKMKNIEAGYSPEVVNEYKNRSGQTSEVLRPKYSKEEIEAEMKRRGLK